MKAIYILAAAALAMTACDSNDDNPVTSPVAVQVSATIDGSVPSRAGNTEWAANDRIGITANVGVVEAKFINMEYVTAGSDGNFTGNTIYFYIAVR